MRWDPDNPKTMISEETWMHRNTIFSEQYLEVTLGDWRTLMKNVKKACMNPDKRFKARLKRLKQTWPPTRWLKYRKTQVSPDDVANGLDPDLFSSRSWLRVRTVKGNLVYVRALDEENLYLRERLGICRRGAQEMSAEPSSDSNSYDYSNYSYE
jgi:hypothetical protein